MRETQEERMLPILKDGAARGVAATELSEIFPQYNRGIYRLRHLGGHVIVSWASQKHGDERPTDRFYYCGMVGGDWYLDEGCYPGAVRMLGEEMFKRLGAEVLGHRIEKRQPAEPRFTMA